MFARRVIALAGLAACSFDPDRSAPGGEPGGDAPPVETVFRDCMDALAAGVTTNGVLSIDPDVDGPKPAFDAYCDMTTAGGGWTLVWSYGFTDYANFMSGPNGVTPQPTWSPSGDQPASTTVPLGPGMPGALEFARWVELGENFLVDSNINHVISCRPANAQFPGSLSRLQMGSLDCTVVRDVAQACPGNAPRSIGETQGAIGLFDSNVYYYWDARDAQFPGNWPTHDPCGINQPNHVKGVSAPYGAVYLRR